jgi:hypothetical protein
MLQIIKLVNGQDVIADVISIESDIIFVDEPLTINFFQKTSTSPPVVYLQRYIPFSDKSTTFIKSQHVMSMCTPLKSMQAYYKSTLKNLALHIDPMLDQELAAASGSDEISEKSQASLALLEKELTKATLN